MNDKTIKKVKATLDTTSSTEIIEEVDAIAMNDPVDKTKRDVLNFLSRRFKNIEEDRSLKKLVHERIYSFLENTDNDISLNQLMGIYKTLGEDETAAVDSLLQILRPVANAPNPWIERKTTEEAEKEKAFKNLEGKDLQSIEKVGKFMDILVSSMEGKLEKEEP